MHLWQALFLGALQGVSELFPVSSLAQTILIPALLKWDLNQANSDFLAFVVALHLATAIALFVFFWKDWKKVVQGFVGSLQRGKLVYDEPSKFAWLLVAGTVIVGLLGLIFEKKLRLLFDDPGKAWIVAIVLVVNGVIMLLADLLKKQAVKGEAAFGATAPAIVASPHAVQTSQQNASSIAPVIDYEPASSLAGERRNAEQLTFIEATAIGATQALALLPGISRSGVTICAGLLAGLTYEQATRFSFMLATPVIGLAAILKVPRLLAADARDALGMNIAAAMLAGITAYFSTKFLMKYFQHNRLSPFGWYCIIFGLFALFMLR